MGTFWVVWEIGFEDVFNVGRVGGDGGHEGGNGGGGASGEEISGPVKNPVSVFEKLGKGSGVGGGDGFGGFVFR